MRLRSVKADDISTIATWMSDKQNYPWLDFGNGIQSLSAPALKIMIQREIHEIRMFTSAESNEPIGLVALSDINLKFKSAVLWFLLGNKKYAGQNYTSRAVSAILEFGFKKMGLLSVFAWTLEHNVGSQKVLERNNFKFIGTRRRCHQMDGKAFDRFLYDLLESEHKRRV